MATESEKSSVFVIVAVVAVLAFAGGYYYFQQKDKDTLFSFNVGGKEVSAEVEHQ